MGKLIKISKYKPSALQGRLDFSPVAQLSFKAEHSLERVAFQAICVLLVALACGYLYFVTASVLHVMARREAIAHITNIQSTIGSLEQQYFALSQDLTPQVGSTLGLAPVSKINYVYRQGTTMGAATMARNEI